MSQGPFTTITVEDYNRVNREIRFLSRQLSQARALLESGHTDKALEVLRQERAGTDELS